MSGVESDRAIGSSHSMITNVYRIQQLGTARVIDVETLSSPSGLIEAPVGCVLIIGTGSHWRQGI